MAVTSAADAAGAPPRRKVALITGINGQDGSYLAELLLTKGYAVVGIKRRASSFNQPRLDAILATHPRAKNLSLHYGDMSDASALAMLMRETKPDEVYNLAAQSHVAVSFVMPKYTAEVDGLGTLNLLESIRLAGLEKTTRFYQASTSEMFGLVQEVPQRETTPFYPRSPYACAKLYAHALTVNYRESYGIFACSGILFNHESPRRGENFVTRKITRAVAAIAAGAQDCVVLGNLDARRDWGHARDYVHAMWAMLQVEAASDYVIATGETRTVRCFCEAAFAAAGLGQLLWRGAGAQEVGVSARTGAVLVRVSERYYRPAEVELLIGDPAKAVRDLGFDPRATSFEELVAEMVANDMAEHAAQARIADAMAKAAAAPVAFAPAATQCDAEALAAAAVEAPPAEEWGFACASPAAADEGSDEEAPRAACGGVAARVADLEARAPQLMSGHDA